MYAGDWNLLCLVLAAKEYELTYQIEQCKALS